MSDNKLDQRQMESRKEIVIPLWPKQLYKGYIKLAYDKPVEAFKAVARKLDDIAVNKRMRTGVNAVVTMPAGIIARNAARSAHYVADEKFPGAAGGVVGTAAAWWFAGKAAFAWATTSIPGISGLAANAGIIGAATKVATLAVTTVVSGLAVAPLAFMAGTVGAAAISAVVIAGLSTVPAALNLKTGLLRTLDRLKGIKNVDYDGAKEEQEITYNSLSARNERKEYNDISYRVRYLSDDHQKEIFDNLKHKFDKAAAVTAANTNQPAPVAQPAAAAPKATP